MQPKPTDPTNTQNSPTMEELAPSPPTYPVNSTAVSELFDRAQRPAELGEANRVTLTFTITPQTDQEWRDFLQTFTGTQPRKGKGISSALVELAMKELMATVADFKTEEVAQSLREISASDSARRRMAHNLTVLAALLE